MAVSADRRLVASAGDATVRLWDVESGTALHALRPDLPYERMDITGLPGSRRRSGRRSKRWAQSSASTDSGLLIESLNAAFADRHRFYGDQDVVPMPSGSARARRPARD